MNARQHATQAARASADAVKTMESYLKVTAPFDGVVTSRLIHPGALVGPNPDSVLLEIEQVSTLRLIVSVPEEDVGGIVRGANVSFGVPAYPGRGQPERGGSRRGGLLPERSLVFPRPSIQKRVRCLWS